ncbi:MAG: hypothetical protein DMG60_02495 [Acidobacteria bacterium]|nr:MAG: hypothetical protein DMG60_02495 [Acidobacteriota bacterium]
MRIASTASTRNGGNMKRQIVSLLGVLALLLVAACANAQGVNVKANVPFDFTIGKSSLPAGAYSIQSLATATGSVLAIRGENAAKNMLASANSAETLNPSPNSRLVFHRYGDQYFLSQIWLQGEKVGRQFRISRREAEMAKSVQTSEDVIVLAALR